VTPLEIAVYHRSVQVVQVLIRSGANLNTEFQSGPIVIWAVREGEAELAKELIKVGAPTKEVKDSLLTEIKYGPGVVRGLFDIGMYKKNIIRTNKSKRIGKTNENKI